MEILYLLVPLSVMLVFAIGLAFWWSLRSGQFDDLEGPAHRILMDDDRSSRVGGSVRAEMADPRGNVAASTSGGHHSDAGKKDVSV